MKTKVIELLYSWTLALPEESKIKDAYHMLKRQGTRLSAQAGGAGLGFEGLRRVQSAGLAPGAPLAVWEWAPGWPSLCDLCSVPFQALCIPTRRSPWTGR